MKNVESSGGKREEGRKMVFNTKIASKYKMEWMGKEGDWKKMARTVREDFTSDISERNSKVDMSFGKERK